MGRLVDALILILIVSVCVPCGGDGGGSVSYDYTCVVPIKSYAGCCSGHGGAKTCSPPVNGYYFRSDTALMCADETSSPTCTL